MKEENGEINLAYVSEETNGKIKEVSLPKGEDESPTEERIARDQWSSPVEFLLSCIAMSVGLGNVWRFPFTAYENGGGAFLIPYIIVLVFIGKPLYYMELCMGQFASYGSVKVWEVVPAFKGIGYGQAIATWCVVTYYVSLMALTVFYFFASFSSTLPWSYCPADVLNCIDTTINTSIVDINNSISSPEAYFLNDVLKKDQNGLDKGIFPPEWRLTLCLLLSWILLFAVLVKGVKSSGKSAYFTALFPYVVLFILLGRGVTLPGAVNGIKFFITPQWEKLLDPKVWYAAVSQSFFSLGVGFGIITTFSSYNDFRHNVFRDAAIISVADTLTSLLAGFTIFGILGHLAEKMEVDDISLVIKGGGSTLAFVSYPDVLARFDFAPQLFAVLFFLMLFTLGIGSASALTASIITIISDAFPRLSKLIITSVVCITGFLLGLFYVTPQGSYILDLIDHYGGTFIVYILTFFEVVAIQWIYGFKNFTRDIEFMLGRKTGIYWAFCWKVFIPLLLLIVFIYNLVLQEPLKSGSYAFSTGANGFGWLITAVAVGMVPLCFIFTLAKLRKTSSSWKEAIKACFVATAEWNPKDPIIRKQYKEFLEDHKSHQLTGIDNPGAEVAGAEKTISFPALSKFRSIS